MLSPSVSEPASTFHRSATSIQLSSPSNQAVSTVLRPHCIAESFVTNKEPPISPVSIPKLSEEKKLRTPPYRNFPGPSHWFTMPRRELFPLLLSHTPADPIKAFLLLCSTDQFDRDPCAFLVLFAVCCPVLSPHTFVLHQLCASVV